MTMCDVSDMLEQLSLMNADPGYKANEVCIVSTLSVHLGGGCRCLDRRLA